MKRLLALLLFSLTLFLTACGDGLNTEKIGGVHTETGDLYPERVAMFNETDIGFDEFRYYYLNFRDQYLADQIPLETDEDEARLKEEVLENLKIKYAARQLAEEKGLSLTANEQKEVRQEIRDTLALYGKEALVESLHASYMSQQMFREMNEYNALYDKLFNALYGEDGSDAMTDDAFLDYYRDTYLAAKEIFLAYERGESAGNCEKTLSRAEAILAEYQNGADFWALVEKYGEDPAMELEPDGYYFTEGEAEDVLYRATLALAEGEVSQPVEGASGVYLIMRTAIRDEKALKRKADVLSGYSDGAGNHHSGVYEESFEALLREKSQKITVAVDPVWDQIRSDSVF